MPDKVSPGPLCGNPPPREAVCIHTKKVYDSCREKECLQDIRVFLTRCSQAILDNATSVRPKTAELLWVYIDVEPIAFNRGFYTVDAKYFYKITADAFTGVGRPREICGLASFDKRTVLFGSEGSVRIFSSQFEPQENDIQNFEKTNLPIAVVEIVDPVLLSVKILEDEEDDDDESESFNGDIPESICNCFEDVLVVNDPEKKLFATLGQFSIIKLERDIQLLMPAYDICLPQKECGSSSAVSSSEAACEMFEEIKFPVDEFFPPQIHEFIKTVENTNNVNCVNCVNSANRCNSSCGSCRRR